MTHRAPTPQDHPAPDADATGYDAREHEHGQHAVGPTYEARLAGLPPDVCRSLVLGDWAAPRTAYQVWHHEHALSPEYGTMSEAELFRLFDTPGTPDYVVRPVHATDPRIPT